MLECLFMNLVVGDLNPVAVMKDDVYVLVLDLDRKLLGLTADIYYLELCIESYLKKFDRLKSKDRISEMNVISREIRFHPKTPGSWF